MLSVKHDMKIVSWYFHRGNQKMMCPSKYFIGTPTYEIKFRVSTLLSIKWNKVGETVFHQSMSSAQQKIEEAPR